MLLIDKFQNTVIFLRNLSAKFGGLEGLRKNYMEGNIVGDTLHELEKALYSLAIEFRFYVF